MEVRGLVLLRVSDAQYGKIRLSVENNDDKGFQMQVLLFTLWLSGSHLLFLFTLSLPGVISNSTCCLL